MRNPSEYPKRQTNGSHRSRGNKKAVSKKGGFGECALVSVFGTGEHPNVPSFRVLAPGENIRMYPRSGFW